MSIEKKRRIRTIFSVVDDLESQDKNRKRQRKDNKSNKARAAQEQVELFKHLMECRILLQKCRPKENDQEDDNEGVVNACNEVLDNLLKARQKLLGSASSDNGSNEQVIEQEIANEYTQRREEWMKVLDKRHSDLRLHMGLATRQSFKVMDSSFSQQVQATVLHEQSTINNDNSTNSFNDDKVYQFQLSEFLSQSSNNGEPNQQRVRRSLQNMKRTSVDRKASKGRKIRYTVHPKLVNFTFPVPRPTTQNGMMEDEWFQSLFGGVASTKR